MGKLSKRLISIVTSVVVISGLLFTNIPAMVASAATAVESGVSTNVEAVGANQAATIQDGAILHAWCWSFETIEANMADIAAAGYTSIQTSPAQACLEGSGGTNPTLVNTIANPTWYYHYQPTYFTLGNYQLGTAEQFKSMTDTAHQYGLKIIVDVVANHLSDTSSKVDQELYNDRHKNGQILDWTNRTQVTQNTLLTLPDINTAGSIAQTKIGNYLATCAEAGADGFRFDAAKSIELPTESGGAPTSQFWPTVLAKAKAVNPNIFIYGETLQGDEPGTNFPGYAKIMNVTGSTYGWFVRSAVGLEAWEDGSHKLGGNGNNGKVTPMINAGLISPYMEGQVKDGSIPNSKVVAFVETHDTYANEGPSRTLSQNQIQLAWAMVAARQGAVPLFFNRPTSQSFGDNPMSPQGEAFKTVGQKGSDDYKQPDIVAMNKFHNAMSTENESVSAENNNQIMKIQRGTKGLVLINVGGSTSISISTSIQDGSYVNKASYGGTFTVSNGKVSGNMSASSIAILDKIDDVVVNDPTVSISPDGVTFKDSLPVTLGFTNATSGTCSIDGATATSFTNGQQITIGANTPVGGTVTVKLTSTDGTKTATKISTFTKQNDIIIPVSDGDAYFKKPSGWATPKIYAYDDSVSPVKVAGAWPGVAMTDLGDGLFSYKLPTGWTKAKVIFTDGSNQIPGASQPGYALTAGQPMIYENGTWLAYAWGALTATELSADKEAQVIGTEITLTGKASGGSGAKIFKFTVNNGSTTQILSNTSDSTVKWTPTVIGTYTITLTVTDSTGAVSSKTLAYTATKGDGKLPVIESVSNTKSGSNITYTVNASGGENVGTGLLFYKFYIVNSDGSTIIGQNYSRNNVFITTATKIKVEVQNSENVTVSQLVTYTTPVNEPVITSFKPTVASPQLLGASITLKATATGTGTLKYKFIADGVTIQNSSTVNSATWKPTKIRTFVVKLEVTDDTGKIATDQFSYTIKNPVPDQELTFDNFTTDVVSPQKLGQTITLSSIASGGTGTIQSKFAIYDGSKWNIVKDFGVEKSTTWKPTKAGTYIIYANVKDATGIILTKTLNYEIIDSVLKIDKFTTDLVSPQKLGQTITLNSIASGGTGTIQSKFAIYDVSGIGASKWNIIKQFGAVGPATWKPTKAGTYILYADVKDATGKIITKTLNYVITDPTLKIESFTTDLVSPQKLGQTITLNSIASGGIGTIQSKFAIYDVSGIGASKWNIIKEFGAVGPAIWKPTKAGTYILYADVKDATGKIITKTLNYVIEDTTPLKIDKFITSVVSPQKVGTSIILKAEATGGVGTIQTSFTAFDGVTITTIKAYSTQGYAIWKPTKAGTYTVSVNAKDTTGKVVTKTLIYIVK